MVEITICSIFGAQEKNICHCFQFCPFYFPWIEEPDAMILVFLMLSSKPAFSLSSLAFIRRLLSSSSLSVIRVVSSAYVSESHSVVSDSLWPHGLQNLWISLGQNTGVGSLSLLQGIFLTPKSNRGLLHFRQILYQLSYQVVDISLGSLWFIQPDISHDVLCT